MFTCQNLRRRLYVFGGLHSFVGATPKRENANAILREASPPSRLRTMKTRGALLVSSVMSNTVELLSNQIRKRIELVWNQCGFGVESAPN